MSTKHDLQHSIQKLFTNREGSYATHADRRQILNSFANDLVSLGYNLRNINGLKQKHIFAVLQHWLDKQLAVSTIE